MVEAIIAAERNIAHRIIEEFMLVANETVAQHLDDHDVPTLYRIHEDPDPLKVEEFEEFVTTLGYSLGAPPEHVKPRHFQKLVEKMHGNAGGEADRVPDAAHDAEGALRPAEPRATSAWRRRAIRTSRRRSADTRTWSCTARCASRGRAA